jgi:hypothetical protein
MTMKTISENVTSKGIYIYFQKKKELICEPPLSRYKGAILQTIIVPAAAAAWAEATSPAFQMNLRKRIFFLMSPKEKKKVNCSNKIPSWWASLCKAVGATIIGMEIL